MSLTQLVGPKDVARFRKAVVKTLDEVDQGDFGFLGFVGTALSDGPVHDIDVLVIPSPHIGVGRGIVAMNRFYTAVDARLRKDDGLYVAPCPRQCYQAEASHIIANTVGKTGQLPVHTLFFPDAVSYTRINPVGFAASVDEHHVALIGSLDVIGERAPPEQRVLDPFFVVSDAQVGLVEGKYPKDLVVDKTRGVLRYLSTHYGIAADTSAPLDPQTCTAITGEVLLELDRLAEVD